MHAITISDTSATTNSPNNSAYMSVSGTVGSNTKDNLLYLSTKEGEMQFVIDYNADTSKGMVLTPGRKLTVYFYRGTDAYLHATILTGEKNDPSSVTMDSSSAVTVTGTVESRSDENMLYLSTPQGSMELKLDAVKNLNNCKVLISGKKISVNCMRGSDAYLHAIDITGV